MGITVTLGPEEMGLAVSLGRGRNSAKDPKWTRKQYDHYGDETANVMGVAAEIAAGEPFGVGCDARILRGGDNGFDLPLPGTTAGVKYNHRAVGRAWLVVDERPGDRPGEWLKDFQSDVMILVAGECDPQNGVCTCGNPPCPCRFHVVGWITREVFLIDSQRVKWKGWKYVLTPDLLYPIESLVRRCRSS